MILRRKRSKRLARNYPARAAIRYYQPDAVRNAARAR